MAENIPFPSVLAPASMVARLSSNTRVHTAQTSGIIKTVENPGARWEFEFGYSEINGSNLKTEMMTSALAKLRGQAKRLQLHHMGRPIVTGDQEVPNLVDNGDLILGNTGWTETPDTGGRITFSNGKVRLESGAGTANISRSVTMTASTYYSVHIAISSGSSSTVRVTVGGSSNDFVGPGRFVAGFSASGSTDIVITNLTNNSFVYVSDIIVSRAAFSVGVDQTGSVINIDGIDASLDDAIKANDFIGINGELKRVTETAVSASDGTCTLIIEPPMNNAIPATSLIVLNRPFSKFILKEDNFSENIRNPFLLGFNVNVIEDIT